MNNNPFLSLPELATAFILRASPSIEVKQNPSPLSRFNTYNTYNTAAPIPNTGQKPPFVLKTGMQTSD